MRIIQRLAMPLLLIAPLLAPNLAPAQIAVGLSIRIGPPVLPVYAQPPCPEPGYLWTPGYWAYGDEGYYWVPGVWVAPPAVGLLWTPGYWGFADGLYGWHAGYWGPHVGFYGGVNYGFGYAGMGFVGGVWAGSVFRYNTAVVNVNTTIIHNTYVDRSVVNNTVMNRASFNGPGGVVARPSPLEQSYARENHIQPTANQVSHQQAFVHDRTMLAAANHGAPATAAMDRVGGQHFSPQGRTAARPAEPARQAETRPAAAPATREAPAREAAARPAQARPASARPAPARPAARAAPAREEREERK